MTIKELIKILEKEDPNRIMKKGFHKAQSYRGYYDELAVEPAENVLIKEMIETLKGALDKKFEGYKGGMYTMYETTNVWMAKWGDLGYPLSPELLECWLENQKFRIKKEIITEFSAKLDELSLSGAIDEEEMVLFGKIESLLKEQKKNE